MSFSLILVICSGLAHAVWNLLTKSSTDKAVYLWCIFMPSTILLLPLLAGEMSRAVLSPAALGMLVCSAALQAFYAWLLSHTYRRGDLSQVYPVMRGTPTLLIPLAGVCFLGERLTLWGWAGIVLMLAGFAVMGKGSRPPDASQGPENAGASPKWTQPVVMALGVGVTITCYTLVDKWNLQHLSPLAILEVTNIGFVLGLTPAVIRQGRRMLPILTSGWGRILSGAILSPGSYLLFLFAIREAEVASLAPLREIGIVFGTVLGLVLLKESFPARRLTASAIVLSGILLIAFLGS
ncbi:DMT family transporter [Paenibacillus mesotrionivorans]|uniref:DMT family transporter n=1 Tax=Paenibacillus mesotrionivorans TaxID=3160968 RepID=A0ACC7NUX1_9BACL